MCLFHIKSISCTPDKVAWDFTLDIKNYILPMLSYPGCHVRAVYWLLKNSREWSSNDVIIPTFYLKKGRGYCYGNMGKYSIKFGVWVYHINGASKGKIYFASPPGKGSKFQFQSPFQRFLYQTLCVFSQMKDTKHIRGNFLLSPGSCPRGGTWEVLRGKNINSVRPSVRYAFFP